LNQDTLLEPRGPSVAQRAEHDKPVGQPGEGSRDRVLAFFILRLTLGTNIFIHGSGRIVRGLQHFYSQYESRFTTTFLPPAVVHVSLAIIPWVEGAIGFLLIFGLWTRWALAAGGLLMTVLVFGTAIREDWNGLFIQMLYALIFYVMLVARRDDHYSVDTLLNRPRKS
jgi:thiosulfate dehydrogenase (quinone) large subunit